MGTTKSYNRHKVSADIEALESRIRAAVPPLSEPPLAPEHLGEAGRALWVLVAAERYATLTAAEVPQLERYADLADRRARLMADLDQFGWSTEGSRGQRVIAPEATALTAVEHELRQLERQLGLGPAFRAKLAIDLLSAEQALRGLNSPTIAQIRAAQEGTHEP